MTQPSAQAIVPGANAHAGLTKSPCWAQHRGAAGFMAEFSTAITYSACAAKPGSRPLQYFFRANLDRKRQIWPASWCDLRSLTPLTPMSSHFVPGNATEGGAETELHAAAWAGSLEEVRCLIKKGANANCVDSAGETPLHGAAAWGHAETVHLMLTLGANPNVAEAAGLTPLHWAASHGNIETVKVFVSAGAVILAKDHRGLTPADYAKRRNEKAIAQYLEKTAKNHDSQG